MHTDEIGLGHQLLQSHHPNAHLSRPSSLHIGVIGNQIDPEGSQTLSNQEADPTQANDAYSLVDKLNTGVFRALPLPLTKSSMRRRNVSRSGQHQGHCQLCRTGDIGGWRIDHHHAVLRGNRHIDIVEANSSPGDNPQARCDCDGLFIHLGRRPDQDRLGLGQRCKQLAPVGSVAVSDLKPVAKGLDGRWAELFSDEYDGSMGSWGHRSGLRHQPKIAPLSHRRCTGAAQSPSGCFRPLQRSFGRSRSG